jgi:hypothetical protein
MSPGIKTDLLDLKEDIASLKEDDSEMTVNTQREFKSQAVDRIPEPISGG